MRGKRCWPAGQAPRREAGAAGRAGRRPTTSPACCRALMRERERLARLLRGCNGVEGLRLRLARAIGLPRWRGGRGLGDRRAVLRAGRGRARRGGAASTTRTRQPRDLAAGIRTWLERCDEDRAACWQDWHGLFLTKDGKVRAEVAADAGDGGGGGAAARGAGPPRRAAACWRRRERCWRSAHPVLAHYRRAQARRRPAGLRRPDRHRRSACCAIPAAPGCCSSSMAASTTCCWTRRRTATRRNGASPPR